MEKQFKARYDDSTNILFNERCKRSPSLAATASTRSDILIESMNVNETNPEPIWKRAGACGVGAFLTQAYNASVHACWKPCVDPCDEPVAHEATLQASYNSIYHEDIEIFKQKIHICVPHVAPTRHVDTAELERSVSELTMRSSYASELDLTRKLHSENRRMAYYYYAADGKHSDENRRCYFTGELIVGPFYAGLVQQGLKTLVVLCLPLALGLGTQMDDMITKANVDQRKSQRERWILNRFASSTQKDKSTNHGTAGSALLSTANMFSFDNLNLSINDDLDPYVELDHDFLLPALAAANETILDRIRNLYQAEFETLPAQVRDPAVWKLCVKFCFFSGLPIAYGEMHYKVLDQVADQVYGREIVLSHDIMQVVNGSDSAELLALPNQNTFRYLKKHYSLQCNKLDVCIFQRHCWERVVALKV